MYVKFCGFTNEADIKAATSLPIDAVGFITYEKSKRYVNTDTIKTLVSHTPKAIDTVLVTVNTDEATLSNMIGETCVNTVQFHGSESVAFIKQFKRMHPEIQIIKALHANHHLHDDIQKYQPYVDLFIIDTPSKAYGGTGKTFDWSLLKNIDAKYLIAGGINLNHVKNESFKHLTHSGSDLSSSIEQQKGIKDMTLMQQFICTVKEHYYEKHPN